MLLVILAIPFLGVSSLVFANPEPLAPRSEILQVLGCWGLGVLGSWCVSACSSALPVLGAWHGRLTAVCFMAFRGRRSSRPLIRFRASCAPSPHSFSFMPLLTRPTNSAKSRKPKLPDLKFGVPYWGPY